MKKGRSGGPSHDPIAKRHFDLVGAVFVVLVGVAVAACRLVGVAAFVLVLPFGAQQPAAFPSAPP